MIFKRFQIVVNYQLIAVFHLLKDHLRGKALFNINQMETSAETIVCHNTVAQLDDKTRSRLEDYVGGRSQSLTFDILESFLEKEISVCDQQYHMN